MTSLRIGIAGAGPAGLTFASILSRESKAKGRKVEFEIFERGDPKRDQGSGWDLNKTAQDALTRAGLHVPDVQRKGSDTVRFYKCNESSGSPLLCLRMPSLLTRLGIKKDHIMEMMNPETERNKIIDGLLKALGPDVKVRYNCQITGARHIRSSSSDGQGTGDQMELLGAEGKPLGSFDLLVDASGVSAPLRHNRFSPKADAFYTGTTFVQGVVNSPEESWPTQVVKQLGEGTLALVGPSKDGKGYVEAFAQRYGANPEDKMANISVRAVTKGPGDVAAKLGLEQVHGFTKNKEDLAKVKSFYMEWLGHPEWPQVYKDAFKTIDGLRILPIFMHPLAEQVKKETLEGTDDIPLIGIGDALHALPPWSGMSGNYALADAADLATALLNWIEEKDSSSLPAVLRTAETKFLDRAETPRQRCIAVAKFQNEHAKHTKFEDFNFMTHFSGGKSVNLEYVCTAAFFKAMTWLNWWDNYGIATSSSKQ